MRRLLERILRESPVLAPVWRDWQRVALPDAWLVAGYLAQTVWNHRFGMTPGQGIADLDLVWFDPSLLSADHEAAQEARLAGLWPGVKLDVKNEARVHLWYARKFGKAIRPYRSVADAVASFPTTATAIAVRPAGDGFEVLAPFGIADLMTGVVRANRRQITQDVYAAKVARWRQHWPGLTVLSWDQGWAGRATPAGAQGGAVD